MEIGPYRHCPHCEHQPYTYGAHSVACTDPMCPGSRQVPAELLIAVTSTDWATGTRSDCHQCAIAIATRRALSPMLGMDAIHQGNLVSVAPERDSREPMTIAVDWYGGNADFVVYSMTAEADELARAWDNDEPVHPFTFPAWLVKDPQGRKIG